MNDLPVGWTEVRFGNINSYSGRSVDPSTNPLERFELYSVPTFPTGSPESVLGAEIGSTKQSVEPNDVLVCKINPRINRVWQVMAAGADRQIASSEWIVMRAPGLCPSYLRHYFCSPAFRELICDGVTGVGGSLTRAQPKRVAYFPVPIAPLSEQQRIAEKLDTVLARVDSCKDRLDRVLGILKRLRQSVLAAATSGELTREWREERDIGEEWTETRIENIAHVGTGSTPLRSNSAFFAETGTPWITSAMTGLPFVTHAEEYVTDLAIAAHRLKRYPPGTLLVAMYGEGKTRGQVTELRIEATVNQACAAIVVDTRSARAAFVRLALEAKYLEMRELAEGGNQPNLNLTKIKEFPLTLPSMEEQEEIAARVDVIFEWISTLDSRLRMAQRRVDLSTPAVLAKAFRGELVSQDPNDEPASMLLDRLHSTFTATEVSTRKRVSKQRSRTSTKADMNMPTPKGVTPSHLANILKERGALSPEALWRASKLEIDDFYDQLKHEVDRGRVRENIGDDPNSPRFLESTA